MTYAIGGNALDPAVHPALYEAMRFRRSSAFIIDAVLITALMGISAVVIFVLGVVTLGLGWLLYFVVWPAIAVLYYAFTFAGQQVRTPGMAFMGIELVTQSGGRPDYLVSLAHPILFYLSVTFLTPFILAVSLLSARKLLAHDVLLGTMMVNSGAFARAGGSY